MARKITEKMFALIDGKLKNHGAAQLAIETKNARDLFIYAAETCVGIKEEGGNNKGLYIVELQKRWTAKLDLNHIAWRPFKRGLRTLKRNFKSHRTYFLLNIA